MAIDGLNSRYGKSLVTMGPWKLPPGGNLGGKISFTRIQGPRISGELEIPVYKYSTSAKTTA